ncbi:anti-phage dCTP deaminase [Echinicola rosea]|uniref:Cytidine deaminase n=1 Tax=Echinicola rosea TaxID=1807691 RepID=A0ABQ1VD27_9BACT|nr:anti-phage dCTP deaminase [Echinicola rosea]GGF49680.1 cytidine deaminase [Echinicola rosea]
MGDALEKQLFTDQEKNENAEDKRKIKEKISDTHTEELVIALCGPIGTDIHLVSDRIGKIIEEQYGYTVVHLRLSKFIKDLTKSTDFKNIKDKNENYHKLIEAGNKLREKHGSSILAELAINEIAVKRETLKGSKEEKEFKSHRVCYIIDSIKNVEEFELLRLIYRDIFYFVGVFSNLEVREKFLEDQGLKKDQVYKLFDRDSGEELNFGQKVSNTFVQADFFLRIDRSTSQAIDNKLNRFLNIVFKTEVITPTYQETAMYLATASSGNSACLSRQVGASITDIEGEVLSVGWNDVPKSGGGVYKYSTSDSLGEEDHRCMNLKGGLCFNDEEKRIIREALVNELIDNKLVDERNRNDLIDKIQKSRIKELIEFSRAVHAEMHAIIQASQKSGQRVVGGKLFCTTYPCHNCARHIIAAGIKEVYYIEPYRKSLALKLHSDSITEDESKKDYVRILMYDGVSPKRYLEFFKMSPNSRKKDGKKISEPKKTSAPKNTVSLQAIPILEKTVTKTLKSKQLI